MKSLQIKPYVDEFVDWHDLLKNKHLLLDANVFIYVIECGAERIFDKLKSLGTTLCYIHPIQLELLRTNNESERLKRLSLMQNCVPISWRGEEQENSLEIQKRLYELKVYPEPVDLYLSGVLAKYKRGFYLATANLSHFPFPIFRRESGIILQNNTSVKFISILSYSHGDPNEVEGTDDPFNIPF